MRTPDANADISIYADYPRVRMLIFATPDRSPSPDLTNLLAYKVESRETFTVSGQVKSKVWIPVLMKYGLKVI